MTHPPRHPDRILDDLRRRGDDARHAEELLWEARREVAYTLLEGATHAGILEMTRMAAAAGISRKTAYKLLHKAEREAADAELSARAERMSDLIRMGSRSEAEEAELRRLVAAWL